MGRGDSTIEASIWVAVIDGREWRPASARSRLWTTGTRSIGISMPRSPRATMIPLSALRMIASAFSAAWGFSIFAISGMSVPPARTRCSTGSRSSARRTKDTASRSIPCSTAKSTQSRSVRLADGRGISVPGMFSPWCEATAPPTSTAHRISPDLAPSTRSRTRPSAR